MTCFTVARQASAQVPIRVWVFTAADASGFVDDAAGRRAQFTKDLASEVKRKKKILSLAESADSADVVVEVTAVDYADGAVMTRRGITGLKSEPEKEYRVAAVLRVGDYQTTLSRQSIFTNILASKLADDVEKWVRANGERLRTKPR